MPSHAAKRPTAGLRRGDAASQASARERMQPAKSIPPQNPPNDASSSRSCHAHDQRPHSAAAQKPSSEAIRRSSTTGRTSGQLSLQRSSRRCPSCRGVGKNSPTRANTHEVLTHHHVPAWRRQADDGTPAARQRPRCGAPASVALHQRLSLRRRAPSAAPASAEVRLRPRLPRLTARRDAPRRPSATRACGAPAPRHAPPLRLSAAPSPRVAAPYL